MVASLTASPLCHLTSPLNPAVNPTEMCQRRSWPDFAGNKPSSLDKQLPEICPSANPLSIFRTDFFIVPISPDKFFFFFSPSGFLLRTEMPNYPEKKHSTPCLSIQKQTEMIQISSSQFFILVLYRDTHLTQRPLRYGQLMHCLWIHSLQGSELQHGVNLENRVRDLQSGTMVVTQKLEPVWIILKDGFETLYAAWHQNQSPVLLTVILALYLVCKWDAKQRLRFTELHTSPPIPIGKGSPRARSAEMYRGMTGPCSQTAGSRVREKLISSPWLPLTSPALLLLFSPHFVCLSQIPALHLCFLTLQNILFYSFFSTQTMLTCCFSPTLSALHFTLSKT